MSISSVLGCLEQSGKIGPARLVEMGKIKIGGLGETRQGASGTGVPRRDDHFTIVTNQRNANGDLSEAEHLMDSLLHKYADEDGKLRAFPIRLLSNNIDEVLQSSFVWYGGKARAAESDGQTVTWFNSKKDGKRLAEPITEPWHNDLLKMTVKGQPMFKVSTTFDCVIADPEAHWGGVYRFRTTGLISTRRLHSSLVFIQRLTGGVLEAMPLWLVLRPEMVTPEGKASTIYAVHVELRGTDLKQLQHEAHEQAKYRIEFRKDIEKYDRQFKNMLAGPNAPAEDEPDDEEVLPTGTDTSTPSFGYGIDVTPPATETRGDDAGQGESGGADDNQAPAWPEWMQTILNRIAAANRMSVLEPIGDELMQEYRHAATPEPDKVEFFPPLFSEWTVAMAKVMRPADRPRLLNKIGGWHQYLPQALHQSMMKVLT